MKKNLPAAMTVLRIGLAFVFIWFGVMQLQAPAHWTSFLPSFLKSMPISGVTFVLLNGVFEIVAGILIAIGAWTRITALLLALHLFGIAGTIGLTAVGVRDIGLSVATLALAIGGAGGFSVDEKAEQSLPLRI